MNWQAMDCPDDVDIATVLWVRQDAVAACKQLGMPDGTQACAGFERLGNRRANATIYAGSDVEDRILGHELRHAFGCSHKQS